MSRAFTKEQDGDAELDPLPDRPISPHPNLVTREGLALIEASLGAAREALAEANASDDRAATAAAAREMRYWTARRASAQVVEAPADLAHVRFGSTVAIDRDDGRRQTFRIVGEDEADPARGTLSHISPMARALMGKSVGDLAQVGESEVEIISIR